MTPRVRQDHERYTLLQTAECLSCGRDWDGPGSRSAARTHAARRGHRVEYWKKERIHYVPT